MATRVLRPPMQRPMPIYKRMIAPLTAARPKQSILVQPVSGAKVTKKIKTNNRSFFEIVSDDLKDSLSVVFKRSEVMVFVLVAIALVIFHPDGMQSGPLGDLSKNYPDHSFVKFLDKQFQKFLATFVFIPVWFSVPKDKVGPSVIITVVWIAVSKVNIQEHFALAFFLFLILSVKRVQTRASIVFAATIVYTMLYGNVKSSGSQTVTEARTNHIRLPNTTA